MNRPKLFLAPHTTLRGNRAHEWRGTTARPEPVPQDWRKAGHFVRIGPEGFIPEPARKGAFWLWLVNLTREAARTGNPWRPGGRAGW